MIAHNLARWMARIGLGAGIVTAKTLRRRLFGLVARLTRSARRLMLHLPACWPIVGAHRPYRNLQRVVAHPSTMRLGRLGLSGAVVRWIWGKRGQNRCPSTRNFR